MERSKSIIVIAGSTGVGKTDVALTLGNHLPIEIVNADLGQFYGPLTIGTAKPPWKESPIRHHLFDIFKTPYYYTAAEFRKQIATCINDIWDRGKIPVIVGGSTFYIESIFFEFHAPPIVHKDKNDVQEILKQAELSSWDMLYSIDPERAMAIHHNDRYRINRSLEMWNKSGVKPSEQKPHYNPVAPYLFFSLIRNRSELYNRINQRVRLMIEDGWIDEVKALMDTPWEDFVMVKKFIGYSEIREYILQEQLLSLVHRKQKLEQIISIIAQKTRNYAKRQNSFWRRLEKKLSDCLVIAPEYTNSQLAKAFMQDITATDSYELGNAMSELIKKAIKK